MTEIFIIFSLTHEFILTKAHKILWVYQAEFTVSSKWLTSLSGHNCKVVGAIYYSLNKRENKCKFNTMVSLRHFMTNLHVSLVNIEGQRTNIVLAIQMSRITRVPCVDRKHLTKVHVRYVSFTYNVHVDMSSHQDTA